MQAFLFLTALAAASAVDCRKRTIPDFLCLLTAAAGLISFSPAQFFGVLAALPLLIAALIRPECMGGGDIKLLCLTGLYLGWMKNLLCLLLACVLGIVFALVTLKRRGTEGDARLIPWGPSISAAAILTLLWGDAITAAYLSLF